MSYGPRRMFTPRKPKRFSPKKFHSDKPGTGLSFFEKVTLQDIKEGNFNKKVNKIVESLSSLLENDGSYISVKLTANLCKSHKPVVDTRDPQEVVEELNSALEDHLEYKQKLAAELPGKLKQMKEGKNKLDDDELKKHLENNKINKRKRSKSEATEDGESVKIKNEPSEETDRDDSNLEQSPNKISKNKKKDRTNSTPLASKLEQSPASNTSSKKKKQKKNSF